jgi:proline iminopeptidase
MAQETPKPSVSPLTSGEFTTELNGLQLWYKVSGTGPVCLMPASAWGSSSDLYFRTLQPLEKIFTMVYHDSRGTGRSQKAASTKEYTWEHLVADLDALRVHLRQEKVWLMGHSAGGFEILHYACKHPERVSGLVLLCTAAVVDREWERDFVPRLQRRMDQPWYPEAEQELRRQTYDSDEDMKASIKTILPFYWADPAKIADFVEDFEATSMSAVAFRGQTDSHRLDFDLRDRLKGVTAPALIVVGDGDIFASPFHAKRMHLCMPNSKLLLIEDTGHFPWMEQPDAFFKDVPAFLEVLAPSLIRPAGADSSDLKEKVRAMEKAHNLHLLEEELSYYADDARFEMVGFWIKEGKDNLRKLMEIDCLFNSRLTFTDIVIQGDTAICEVEEDSDWLRALGIAKMRGDGRCELRYQDGRIQEIKATPSGQAVAQEEEAVRAFSAWADQNHPEEVARLLNGKPFDLTPDNALDWLKLIQEWQKTTQTMQ